MMRQVLAFVFHATAAAIMTWGWFSLRRQPVQEWIDTQKGGHLQYLTIQGFVLPLVLPFAQPRHNVKITHDDISTG
jgi:hypothetical protein